MSQPRILGENSAAVTSRTISSFASSSRHCRRKSYSPAWRQARFCRAQKPPVASPRRVAPRRRPAKYVIRETRLKTRAVTSVIPWCRVNLHSHHPSHFSGCPIPLDEFNATTIQPHFLSSASIRPCSRDSERERNAAIKRV